MKLPTQAEGVNRQDRAAQAAEMKAAGVNPAFWGELLKKGVSGLHSLLNG